MEEKLTDEEIAKAILQQVEYGAGIPYIDDWKKVRTIKFTEILDFMQRLQDEKYQAEQNLKQCENGYEQTLHIERNKNAELQKQVDELKMAYKDLVEDCRKCEYNPNAEVG